jgi:ADP-ribose pyrophosphatase YjhB (NUDIX family)
MNKNALDEIPLWLAWAREIQAIAQTGDHYALNDFQRARYSRLQEIAVEMVVANSDLDSDIVRKEFRSQVGYTTPKVDVRGAVILDDKLLLVREIIDNCWTMPGGWADVGESPRQSVEREVLEESGFSVRAVKIIGIYDANRFNEVPLTLSHAYKIIFLCEILGGVISTSNETSEANFYGLEEIPENLSYSRTHKKHIEAAFRAYRDPFFIPVFD